MNKTVFYIVFLLCISKAYTQQNHVKNGSFEDYINCPLGESSPGNYQLENCKNWYTPTLATSDYMNVCNNTSVSIPTNIGGYEWPRTGNAYAGIIAFSYFQEFWCEYIQGEISPLIGGKTYEITFYVSCAEGYSTITISRLGALLTSSQFFQSNSLPLQSTPAIVNTTNITDTSGWQKISGKFIASGDERFITIGYFGNMDFSDTAFFQSADPGVVRAAYYFIDDVQIEESSDYESPNIITPNGDYVNDFLDFSVYTKQGLEVVIINRWGQVVFKTAEENHFWDGTNIQKGEKVADGVYFLQIIQKNNIYKTAFVHLMR